MRVTGYQVDGGAFQAVAPTLGQVGVVLQMNGPHVLDFATVTQYLVSLDPGASVSLLSITPPMVPGDGHWYDSGSSVTLVLNGVWGRGDSLSGSRLLSYAIDGGAPSGCRHCESGDRADLRADLISAFGYGPCDESIPAID